MSDIVLIKMNKQVSHKWKRAVGEEKLIGMILVLQILSPAPKKGVVPAQTYPYNGGRKGRKSGNEVRFAVSPTAFTRMGE